MGNDIPEFRLNPASCRKSGGGALRGMTVIAALALFHACSCVSLAEAAPVECHTDRQFHVAVRPFADEPGSLFAVTALGGKAAPGACAFDPQSADFVIGKRGDALWYQNLAGKYLVLQRSTGPQGDLVVIDLSTRQTVLDVPSDDFALEGDTLSFWQRGTQATAANCTTFRKNAANGLGSVISARKLFGIISGKTIATGETRCDAVQ